MEIILFMIATGTSIVGSICGIGGGILIKPILDAIGIMSVSAVSFLSSCTVLAMALVSVGKSVRHGTAKISRRITPLLGIGATAGGMMGKMMFNWIKQSAGNESLVGLVQAIFLGLVTLGLLIYMSLNEAGRVRTRHVENLPACVVIGVLLGIVSSFLGIGGGPLDLAVLVYFFSMDTKEAATNSLCIILIAQAAALLQSLAASSVPEIRLAYLAVMVGGGVIGGAAGQTVNRRLNAKQVGKFFRFAMVLVMIISVCNAARFAMGLPAG